MCRRRKSYKQGGWCRTSAVNKVVDIDKPFPLPCFGDTFYFNKTGSDGFSVTASLLCENFGFSVLFGYADFFLLICNAKYSQGTPADEQNDKPQSKTDVIAGLRDFCLINGVCRYDSILT